MKKLMFLLPFFLCPASAVTLSEVKPEEVCLLEPRIDYEEVQISYQIAVKEFAKVGIMPKGNREDCEYQLYYHTEFQSKPTDDIHGFFSKLILMKLKKPSHGVYLIHSKYSLSGKEDFKDDMGFNNYALTQIFIRNWKATH